MKFGNLTFHILQESFLKFDGGAMFGHVPKTVWNKVVNCDPLNRIQASCNQILIRLNGLNILTDPGMGTKWNEKEIGLYDLSVKTWDELLAPYDLTPNDIDLILMTHLHLDHAGGLTRHDMDRVPQLVFPKARVLVQRGEWDAANNPDMRSRVSYRPDDFLPVKAAGKLELIEGDGELFPGCHAMITSGHTEYHQSFRFTDGEYSLYVLGDVMPSTAQLKPHWVMGYDLIPLQVMASRERLLRELSLARCLAMFGHDPYTPVARIRYMGDGKYISESLSEATQ